MKNISKIVMLCFMVGCGAAPAAGPVDQATDTTSKDPTTDPLKAKKDDSAAPQEETTASTAKTAVATSATVKTASATTPSGLPQGITVLLAGTAMPTCAASNVGQTVYVQDTNIFQYCNDKQTWTDVDLKGADGAAGAAGKDGAAGAAGAKGSTGAAGATGTAGAAGAQGASGYGIKSSSRTATVAECGANGGSALDTWVSVSGNSAYTSGTDTNFNTLKACNGVDGSTAVAAKILQYDTFVQYSVNGAHCTTFSVPDYAQANGTWSFKILGTTSYNSVNFYYSAASGAAGCAAGDVMGQISVSGGSGNAATGFLQLTPTFTATLHNSVAADVHYTLTLTAIKAS